MSNIRSVFFGVSAPFMLVSSVPEVLHLEVKGISNENAFSCPTGDLSTLPFSESLQHAFHASVFIKVQSKEARYSLGSGFIIDPSGYIVTNDHVIKSAHGDHPYEISFYAVDKKDNMGDTTTAILIGTDRESDIAVLKVESDEDLPCLNFAADKKSFLGKRAYAVGNPHGESFPFSVSDGIISNVHRVWQSRYFDYIQTNIQINKGNSGGALLTEDMEVLGVNVNFFASNIKVADGYVRTGINPGLSFAVPAEEVIRNVNDIIRYGSVKRGWIGIETTIRLTNTVQEKNGIDKGAFILREPKEESPADLAGFEKGDIVISADGKVVEDPIDFLRSYMTRDPGSEVVYDVIRDGEFLSLAVTLGDQSTYEQQRSERMTMKIHGNVSPSPAANGL